MSHGSMIRNTRADMHTQRRKRQRDYYLTDDSKRHCKDAAESPVVSAPSRARPDATPHHGTHRAPFEQREGCRAQNGNQNHSHHLNCNRNRNRNRNRNSNQHEAQNHNGNHSVSQDVQRRHDAHTEAERGDRRCRGLHYKPQHVLHNHRHNCNRGDHNGRVSDCKVSLSLSRPCVAAPLLPSSTKRIVRGYDFADSLQNVPEGYSWALFVSVDAERQKGETFHQCAQRLRCPPDLSNVHAGMIDEDGDHNVMRNVFDVERELTSLYARQDEDCRKRRIKRREAELKALAEARSRGQSFTTVYARKVDAYGNSTPVVCMKWLFGLCMYGDECPELHTLDASYLPPCAFFMSNGVCGREDCQFKHIETQKRFYHCKDHVLGKLCALQSSCPDMHIDAKFGSMKHLARCGPVDISDDDRLVQPQELCAAPLYSHAYTPRVQNPDACVFLNRLATMPPQPRRATDEHRRHGPQQNQHRGSRHQNVYRHR